MSIEYFDIQALNRSTTGTFSYESGTPVLQFAIGDVEKYLIGNSLRLCFDFKVFNSGGTQITSGTEVGVSSSVGMNGMIDQLDISSYKSNLMLESIRNYGRCVSTLYNCCFADEQELLDRGSNEGISPSQQFNNYNVGVKLGSMTSSTNYCVPLYSGLLMSQPVFLGQSGLRGLKISVNLSSSTNFLQRMSGSDNPTYEISNVKLIGQYYNPTNEEFSAGRIKSSFISSYEGVMKGQGRSPTSDELETAWTEVVDMGNSMGTPPYEYYSISGFVDSLNSNQSSHSLNLGLSRIRSIFINWLPSSYINNYSQDGLVCRNFVDSTGDLAPIVKFKTSRAGVLYPSRFDITTNSEGHQDATGLSTNDRRSAIYQGVINACKVFNENHYQSGNYKNAIDSNRAQYNFDADDKLASKTQGLGVNFSNISNVGVDFSYSPFQFEIETIVNNAPVNHTLYIFAINRNTLVFNDNQVRVLN